MRGFGVTAIDFALECQMDKLAHLIGMDPMEFRILNAYRDGDMKAHRRKAKNTALIECVQVAAEKAKWRLREEFKRDVLAQGRRRRARGNSVAAAISPRRARPAAQQRTSYDRAPPPRRPSPRRCPAGASSAPAAARRSPFARRDPIFVGVR